MPLVKSFDSGYVKLCEQLSVVRIELNCLPSVGDLKLAEVETETFQDHHNHALLVDLRALMILRLSQCICTTSVSHSDVRQRNVVVRSTAA